MNYLKPKIVGYPSSSHKSDSQSTTGRYKLALFSSSAMISCSPSLLFWENFMNPLFNLVVIVESDLISSSSQICLLYVESDCWILRSRNYPRTVKITTVRSRVFWREYRPRRTEGRKGDVTWGTRTCGGYSYNHSNCNYYYNTYWKGCRRRAPRCWEKPNKVSWREHGKIT